jgi:hypothetical protein
MNIYIKSFIIILVLIIIYICIRTINYNHYLQRIHPSLKENTRENFEGKIATDLNQIKFSYDMPNNIKNMLSNPDIIYSDISGTIFIINGTNIFTILKDQINQSNLSDFLNIDNSANIDGGFFNHLNGTLNLFNGNMVSIYDFKTSKITAVLPKPDFFNIKTSTNFNVKKVLVYYDYLVLFNDKDKIQIFSLTEDKIVENKNMYDIFSKVPKKFDACFINFLDVYQNIPLGTPTFLKNGDIFTLDLETNKFMGPRRIENGFTSNTSSIIVNKTNFKLFLKKSGIYRVFAFGAGFENGGYGGLVFNDIYIKKKDLISVICGKTGERLPVKGKESKNKLSDVYSIKLPYNASCSGCGGTFLFINEKIKLVAGGGGGWSSELVSAPSFCDSEKYTHQNNGLSTQNPKKCLPLKKIIILTENSKNNVRYKIAIKKWIVNIFNLEHVDLEVSELPNINKINKKFAYETDYCEINENSQIEFTFKDVISDYKIQLDYEIFSTNVEEFTNSKVIFIDEQYRKYTIDNFNFTFNYKYITGENIIKFINGDIPEISNIESQPFVTHGCHSDNNEQKEIDLEKLSLHIKKYTDYNPNPNPGEVRYITLQGGHGGGGHSLGDRNSNNIIASGGGGYHGGKTCFINEKYGIEYSGGCGGTSFIDKLNFKNDLVSFCENVFVNNANNDDGYIVFQHIEKRVAQSFMEEEDEELNEKQDVKKDTDKLNTLNEFKFHNSAANNFFDRTNKLNSNIFYAHDSIINNKNEFDFFEMEDKTLKDFHVISIKNKSDLNQMFFGLKANVPFNCFIIGWDKKLFSRTLINLNKKILKDNISQINHGYSKITKSKMNDFFKFLLEHDIYTYSNSLTLKTLTKMKQDQINSSSQIKHISSFNDFKMLSSKNNKNNLFECDLNLDFDEIFILMQFDSFEKKEKHIRYVYTKYSNKDKNNNSQDIKNRTLMYL